MEPSLDVSISFLAKDEPFAAELYAKLEQTLKVFFFPRQQEELAGTDGLESMRTPFLESRVAVILFRQPWGETPWTRVEETAIKDRCLAKGWNSLLFVTLDKPSPLPVWLPNTHIRFSSQDYPVEELVGAVKARVQENGGEISKPNALVTAKRIRAEAELRDDEKRFFRDHPFISQTVKPQVNALLNEIVRKAREVCDSINYSIDPQIRDGQCVIPYGGISLHVHWKQQFINVIEDAELRVRSLGNRLFLPGETHINTREPRELSRRTFRPKLDFNRNLRWVAADTKQLLNDDDVVEEAIKQFLQLVDRANRGNIPRDDRF
jgi:TIR domain